MTRIRIKHDAPRLMPQHRPEPASPSRKQALTPLTHHEILSLMAPFTALGRHADMAASRRDERVLAFKPVEHPAETAADGEQPPLREDLALDMAQPERPRLVRTLTVLDGPAAGLTATLTAEGSDAGKLLEHVDAVPVRRQVKTYDGMPLVRGYHIGVAADGSAGGPVFVDAAARIRGVNFAASADRSRGMPVDIRLTAEPGCQLRLPEDLIAVIGWQWRPLVHIVSYWRGSIDVARREPERTPDIETRLGETVRHLDRTLARPPGEFHAAHLRARWRVTFQRGIPLLIGLGLVAATPLVRMIELEEASMMRMLIFHAPPLLLVSMFLMREMPKIEFPPFPRQLLWQHWIVPAKDAAAAKREQQAQQAERERLAPTRPVEAET